MEIELITKEVLFVLLFIIPGYIGFTTTLMFLTTFFKSFRYRPNKITWFNTLIISIVWSVFTFLILFNITDFNQMIENLDIIKMTLMIFLSIALAESFSIGLWLIIVVTTCISTIGWFVLYKNPNNIRPKKYWSIKRLLSIWEYHRRSNEICSNYLYSAIIDSSNKRQVVMIKLKDGDFVKGIIIPQKTKVIRDELKIENKKELVIIKLEDIVYIKVLNN